MRIALVDDHQLFRKGIAALLATMDEVQLVIEAANGKELLARLKDTQVDIILLDLQMPVLDGFNTLDLLKVEHADVKVIVLTMEIGEETVLRLMENGANGFLAKDAHPDEVRQAIRQVHRSGYYTNQRTTAIMMKGLTDWKKGNRENDVQLNDRELAVLKGICQEHSTVEIAKQLFLSPRTVEGYRSDLLEKINTKNSIGLVLFAAKNGWLQKWMSESP